ncbi:MAG: hypothetical protein O2V44_09955 [Candidatus Bathyarchaeota archaeon]|nr:hypothetical protein [Candidatus Bathyarchaeota archaeon]
MVKFKLKSLITAPEPEVYYYVRFSAPGRLYRVEELSQTLQEDFRFVKTLIPVRKTLMSFIRPAELGGFVPEILFKADTLYAAISPSRATLFQKTRSPFTPKDLELRNRILELYPFTYTGIPFTEPKFEIQEIDKPQNRIEDK